jgi:hypothetical protein
MMGPLILYALKAAVRDRLILSFLTLLLVASSLSIFMGSAAVVEQDRFAVVYAAGSIRALNAAGLVLFIVFFIRRSFEAREIEFVLSRPVGRSALLISYWIAFLIIAIILALVSGVCVAMISPGLFSVGHGLWVLSLIAENMIVASAALFFSMVISSAASASFAVLGFYVLARMMSQVLGIIDARTHMIQSEILPAVMQGISMLMPRLDLMVQTSWLVYGPDPSVNVYFIAMQGAVFSLILLVAAMIDLHRRQF